MAATSTILLAIHLVAMNVASAGPLVCIWLAARGRRGDGAACLAGRQLSRWAVNGLLLGVVTGAALGAAAWLDSSQEFAAAVGRFPTSAVANFVGEVLFALACLVIYAREWERWRGRPWLHGMFAVLAVLDLLYHFPPLMVVLHELSVRPESVAEPILSRSTFRPLMLRPDVLSQSVHFAAASLAAGGIALAMIAQRQRRGRINGSDHVIVAGARIALAATLAQLAIGVWVLFELPPHARGGMIGDAWPATLLFLAAIAGTLGLLHTLGTMALGEVSDSQVRRCVVLMLGVILLMTTILHGVRNDGNTIASSAVTRSTLNN
jgi:hypothetical protein